MQRETLNHYRILEALGRGGMGEVYLAEDTRLHRRVALKVLPEESARSAERRQRFEREATAVAALNHPNIVTVYSIEEAEGVHFITMELVQGQALSSLIPTQGLPTERFLDLALPLADAVAAAHARGIVHRDLKPDNVMVADGGPLKVLDFGLTKLRESPGGEEISDLPTRQMTQEGAVLGTVGYMAPEQVEGKPADQRADVFSLGIVLYEMITGHRPFDGESRAAMMAAILRDEPAPLARLREGLPPGLEGILRRCLAKAPHGRFASAGELRDELARLRDEVLSGSSTTTPERPAHAGPSRPDRRWLLAAAGAILLVAAGLLLWPRRPPEPRSSTPEGGSPQAPSVRRLTDLSAQASFPSLSADGQRLAYAANPAGRWDIFTMRVEGSVPVNLTEDSGVDDTHPAFAPEGERIAFRSERAGGGLFVMGATGESPRRVSEAGYHPAWSPDGTRLAYCTESVLNPMVRVSTSELWVVDVVTGETVRLSAGDAVQPRWSPDGTFLTYWARSATGQRDIFVLPAAGGEPVAITDDAHLDWSPLWSADGRSLYFNSDRGGTMNIWSVLMDPSTGRATGPPRPLTSGTTSTGHLAASADGSRLAYVAQESRSALWGVRLDASGRVPSAAGPGFSIIQSADALNHPDPSPDGRRVACTLAGEEQNIMVVEVEGGRRRMLTEDGHSDRGPAWSPDGGRLAFYSSRSGSLEIWTIEADGSGLRQVTAMPGANLVFPVWAPGGEEVAASEVGGPVRIFRPAPDPVTAPDRTLPAFEQEGRYFLATAWSPDGGRLAGQVMDIKSPFSQGLAVFDLASGGYEVVRPAGASPRWLADGFRLIYHEGDAVRVLDTRSGQDEPLPLPPLAGLYGVSLSRDKQTLVAFLYELRSNIWLLEGAS